MSREIIIRDINDIERAAKEFVGAIGKVVVIALYGEMGAGKTTFTKAICKVLGVTDGVNSPTFTLINEYRTADELPVYHFDFYRIEHPSEALDIGFYEFVDSGDYCIIEWPEKVEEILPPETLRVKISVLEDGARKLIF